MERLILSWSGGKDSAMALRELRRDQNYEITGLLTTVTEGYNRVSMHGVPASLVEQQARAVGLPLVKMSIPPGASNELYELEMREVLARAREEGVSGVAFGDVFLEDIRHYREEKLSQVGMKAIFPIWKRNTHDLAIEFIKQGFRAVLTCVDSRRLDRSFAGRSFDETLLADLPSIVDPSGENGEFHTFVHAGPIFSEPILVRPGEIVLRENRFWYCDLIPDTRKQKLVS